MSLAPCGLSSAPLVFCDNLCTKQLTQNPIFHARVKHIKIDFHFIRDQAAYGDLCIAYVPIEDRLVDLLTKVVPTARFLSLCTKLLVLPKPIA